MSDLALHERLYYRIPMIDEADVTVIKVRVDGRTARIRLDATILYPEGGGQPADSGTIAGFKVIDVQEADGAIWHVIEMKDQRPLPAPGDTVHLVLDRQRRIDHMQQHSGQHLLSAILEQEYGIHTLSFHMGKETCTIDISAASPEDVPASDVEAQLAAWIRRDVPIRVHYCPPEDIDHFKLRKRPPADESIIRVVEIESYDWSPCGGTHLESTGFIRVLKILALERYKGNVRLYFAAGDRAVGLLMGVYEEARRTASALGCGIADIAARAADLSSKLNFAERDAGHYRQKWAEAEIMAAGTSASIVDRAVLVFDQPGMTVEEAGELVKAASRAGKACIAVSSSDQTVIIQVPQQTRGASLASTLKPLAESLQGKGGGGPSFFRARFAERKEMVRFIESAQTLLEGFPTTTPER